MPVTTRSSTRSPPTSRSQHTYSLREKRPPQGFYAVSADIDEDMEMAVSALMALSSSVPTVPSVRRSARIAAQH